jgi:hypothetical protein
VSNLLTDAEHRAMDLTVELTNLICNEIIGNGRTRTSDINELVGDIHAIQRTILKQAAARAYPDRYRLLGGEVGDPPVHTEPDGKTPTPDGCGGSKRQRGRRTARAQSRGRR